MYVYLKKNKLKNSFGNGCQVSKFDKYIWFYTIKIQDFEYKLYRTCIDSQGISSA